MRVLAVFGTRPEAIKMAPVVRALAAEPGVHVATCVTGQHRDMLGPILTMFDIVPQWNLDAMSPGGSLNRLLGHILQTIDPVFDMFKPDWVVVHGDTTSALGAALAAFHRRVPIAHVEAGLRTHDLARPWPEEMNRQTIDGMADLLFAPTSGARANLLMEGIADRRIVTTGNTVVDALMLTQQRLRGDPAHAADVAARFSACNHPGARLLLVTGHRRENFGEGLRSICEALTILAARDDIYIVFPIHLNPEVRAPVMRWLDGLDRISLVEPLAYPDFVWMMGRAHVILTDSGGVQEEAPSLGKPVLIMREVTERPEAIVHGNARLVGTGARDIVEAVARLFDDPGAYIAASDATNLYGDGGASCRIVDALMGRPVQEFIGGQRR